MYGQTWGMEETEEVRGRRETEVIVYGVSRDEHREGLGGAGRVMSAGRGLRRKRGNEVAQLI